MRRGFPKLRPETRFGNPILYGDTNFSITYNTPARVVTPVPIIPSVSSPILTENNITIVTEDNDIITTEN